MTFKSNILVVDDDREILDVIETRLVRSGYRVHKADSGEKALRLLSTHPVDLIISDILMPGISGMELLTIVRKKQPDLPVVLLTGYGSISGAVESIKAGAVDYLTKPFRGAQLLEKIDTILKRVSKKRSHTDKRLQPGSDFFVGQSPEMRAILDLIRRVADSNVNVLILGDSGVGKERVAEQVHQASQRKNKPFVVVDCGSTPVSLLESELFGHVKGAFTHAVRDKKGLIAAADKGTLFLDEIGNVSPEMQMRLLRFLEDRKIRQIGALKPVDVDCRVIAATNTDLEADIKEGIFREDLFYRLRVVTIRIPSLKDRKSDIPALLTHFADRFCRQNGIDPVTFLPETVRWLVDYPWPGNIRELKNAVEGGIVLCKDGVLTPDDFHLSKTVEDDIIGLTPSSPVTLEESEKMAIVSALKETHGNQSKAAEILGISRRSIHYKVKKYSINVTEIRKS